MGTLSKPIIINGMSVEEIEKTLKPCPFCSSKNISYGKTNNSRDFKEWVLVCFCSECNASSYIWNERSLNPEIQKRDELLARAKVIVESHQAVTLNPFKWESCEQWIKSYEELNETK